MITTDQSRKTQLALNIAACWQMIATTKNRQQRRVGFCRYVAVLTGVERVILTVKRPWGESLVAGSADQVDAIELELFEKRNELNQVSLGKHLNLYSKDELSNKEETQSVLTQQANSLNLAISRRMMGAVVFFSMLLIGMFIPVRQQAVADATVINRHVHVLVSQIEGTVLDLSANYSSVNKNEEIGQIDAQTLQTDAINVQAEINILDIQLTESSAYVDAENTRVLTAKRKAAKARLDRLTTLLGKQTLTSPIDGVIEWEPDLLGSFVALGDPLGRVREVSSHTLSIQLPVEDRIGFKTGFLVRFVNNDGSFETTTGRITQLSPTIDSVNGSAFYEVIAELEEALPTGSAGLTMIRGERLLLGQWIFRKPFNYLMAWLSVPS